LHGGPGVTLSPALCYYQERGQQIHQGAGSHLVRSQVGGPGIGFSCPTDRRKPLRNIRSQYLLDHADSIFTPTGKLSVQDLISIQFLTPGDIELILKQPKPSNETADFCQALAGKTLALLFEKPSANPGYL
jgi:hypothetical protein